MGADFIQRAAPTFDKGWDRGRIAMATADLFTRTPTTAARTAAADIVKGWSLKSGDCLTVELAGDRLVARQGLNEVAVFRNPPRELINAVRESCGVAKGTVEQVHEIAAVAEICLC